MTEKNSMGSVHSAAPSDHLMFEADRLISEVLLNQSQNGNNLFSASISARWFDILNNAEPKDSPKILSKLVEYLLKENETANQKLLKMHEVSTGIKIIVHEDNKFISDRKFS